MLTQGVGIHLRSQFGITIDHDLACFRSLIGILPVTPGINSFHHSLHCRI